MYYWLVQVKTILQNITLSLFAGTGSLIASSVFKIHKLVYLKPAC
jgi:hypothetical protein